MIRRMHLRRLLRKISRQKLWLLAHGNRIHFDGLGLLVNKRQTQILIIHRSAKQPGMWQGTLWDVKGPLGDIQRKNPTEILAENLASFSRVISRWELQTQVSKGWAPSIAV